MEQIRMNHYDGTTFVPLHPETDSEIVIASDTLNQAVGGETGDNIDEAIIKVNEKFNDKLDKVITTGTQRVYAVSTNGTQTTIPTGETSGQIPIRDVNGGISVPETPQSNTNAVSKKYVDNKTQDIPNIKQQLNELNIEIEEKTEKVRIDFDGTTFKHDGQTLNYKQLHDIHLLSPDFAFVVYGDRAYLLSYVQDDTTSMRELRFESVIATAEVVKTSGIYVVSNDGINIANVTVRDINSENQGNKVDAITATNKNSAVNYPSNKAFTEYLETVTSPIDRSLSALWALTEGTVWCSETDSTEAYSKVIPSGAKGLSVDGWSGKTVAVNQLMTDGYNTSRVGITRADGVVTATQYYDGQSGVGNSSANSSNAFSIVGHKYVVIVDTFAPSSNSTLSALFIGVRTALTTVSIAPDKWEHRVIISTPTEAQSLFFISNGSYMVKDESYSWRNVHIADLTQMGWGDITSVDDERIKWLDSYLTEHPDYDAGSLVSAPVESVDVQGKNLFISNSLTKNGYNILSDFVFEEVGEYTISNRIATPSRTGYAVMLGGTIVPGGWYGGFRDAGYSLTFTVTEELINKPMSFHGNADTATPDDIMGNIQVEKGSTASAYSPYSLNSIPIPDAVKALPDYGMSAGSAVNKVVSRDGKWFYQRNVGSVDLGDMIYTYWREVFVSQDIYSVGFKFRGAGVTALYAQNNVTYNNIGNMEMTSVMDGYSSSRCGFIFKNSAYTDAEAFRNAMRGQRLIYELETPVETDITDIVVPLGLNALLCEGGGTVTMVNDAELAVQSDIEYAVKISEVG